MGVGSDDIHLAAGPAFYHAAPSGYTNTTLYAGGTVVIMDSWEPLEFLRLVETHRVTTTFLTPAHFIRLLEIAAIDRARFDTTSLRHVIHAGAPCPVDVKQQIISAFPRAEVWEFYGMSEGGATRVSTEEWLERPGTVGRPWPGVAITIRDPDTLDPVEAGADGLVYVTPTHGRFHYHHDDQKTSAAWHESSFTVGDIGHLDADGYLFLTDHASDLVIRSGVNISPRQIEDVLYRHRRAVVDCAVFGVPDDRDGERLRAVVERSGPTSAGEVDAATLEEWCRRHLDAFVVPGEFVLVDDLHERPQRQDPQTAAARCRMDGRAPGNLTRMTDTSIAPVAPGLLRLDDDGIVLLGGWSPTSGRAHFPARGALSMDRSRRRGADRPPFVRPALVVDRGDNTAAGLLR